MTKLGKWMTKMNFSHSNLVTPLELLLHVFLSVVQGQPGRHASAFFPQDMRV